MAENAIKKAAQAAGGQSALARTIGVTPQAVHYWCASGKVPAVRVLSVERATDGEVTRHELRPDLYPYGTTTNLKAYLATRDRSVSAQLAETLGISASFLYQMASGHAQISPARCVAIENATGGAVTRQRMRPDDWHMIWPELADEDAE